MSIKCPYCGEEMIEGQAFIRGTFFGFLLVGLSRQHLWFHRQNESKKELVIESSDSRAGHQCPKCGAVLISRARQHWRNEGPRNSMERF